MSTSTIPKNPKGKLQEQARALKSEIDEKRSALGDRQTWQTGRGRGQADQNDFPAQYFPDQSEEDERMQTKIRLLAAPERPLGDAMMTDKDVEWFRKKEEVKQRIAFDEWFSRLFDTEDINKRRLAQELYPDFYKMREDEIHRQAAIQIALAKMKLYGVRSFEDLKLLYSLQEGDLTLRAVPLYELDTKIENPADKFQKGLFNPARPVNSADAYKGPKNLGRNMFKDGKPELGELATGAGAGLADIYDSIRPPVRAGDAFAGLK